MKKRILGIWLLSLFILASCSTKKKDISLFVYSSEDIYMNHMIDRLNTSLSEYNVKSYYGEGNQLTQNKQLLDALDSKTDMVLMNPCDRLSSRTIVEKCKSTETPLLFFNREPLFEDISDYENCFYVGPDSKYQGVLQAKQTEAIFGAPDNLSELYDKNKDNTIQCIILKGEQGHQDAEKRTAFVIDTLRSDGYSIEVLSITVCNWSKAETVSKMSSLLKDYASRVEIILANNDEMAIGAGEELKKANISIPILGIDATEEGKEAIRKGIITSTVVNDDIGQVDAITRLCDILLNHKDLKKYPYTITKEHFIYIDSQIYSENA